jgi:hypothetical protein
MARKKRKTDPVPSQRELVERNPYFQAERVTYTGEEAAKARALAGQRRRRMDRMEKALQDGLQERNHFVRTFCVSLLSGTYRPPEEGLQFGEDWEPEVREAMRVVSSWPAPKAFAAGYFLGEMLGFHRAACQNKALAGNRFPEATRTKTLKGKLIRKHLTVRPEDRFATYWRALCDRAPHLQSYLESWEITYHGEKAGVITLETRGGETIKIKKEAHRRLFDKLKSAL